VIIESIIGALVPVGVEGIKQVMTRFFGGVKATSIEDQIKLDNNEVEKVKALAELDKPIGQPSQWVVDLRASARYIGALAVIGVGISTLYVPVEPEIKVIALEAANIAFGFLFGSRILAGFRK
jgi:hypothetical protein